MAEENPRTKIGIEIIKLQNKFPESAVTEIYQQNIDFTLSAMEECDLGTALIGYSSMSDFESIMIKKDDEAFVPITRIRGLIAEALVGIAETKCGCQLKE